ncbi:MAG: hypothetical protein ACOC2L_00665 [Candidatus Sumerlaeota bacterium]
MEETISGNTCVMDCRIWQRNSSKAPKAGLSATQEAGYFVSPFQGVIVVGMVPGVALALLASQRPVIYRAFCADFQVFQDSWA